MRSSVVTLACLMQIAACSPSGLPAPSAERPASPTAASTLSPLPTSEPRRLPCPPAPPAASAYQLQPVPFSVELRPLVATVGCDETFSLTMRPSTAVSSVSIVLRSGETVPLTQNAPNVFTTTLRSAQVLARWSAAQGNHIVVGDIIVPGEQGRPFFVIAVRHDGIPDVAIAQLATDAQATPRVLNIHDPSPGSRFDLAKYSKRLYELYGDEFDFVNVVHTRATRQNRSHLVVKNAVQGIGLPLVNQAALYGSAGRLLGITEFPVGTFFDLASESFSHETGHQWINSLRQPPLGPNSGAHWPYSTLATGIMGFSVAGGQGGTFAFGIEHVDGDRYRLTAPAPGGKRFEDIDLYLMGLLPTERVQPAVVFVDQRAQSMTMGAVLQGVRVTVQDVMAGHGARVPDAASSKKDFTVGTIVVSHDRLLEPHELAFFEHMASRAELRGPMLVSEGLVTRMQNPWYVATRGLSTMDARMRPKGR